MNITEIFSHSKPLKTYIKKHPKQFTNLLDDSLIYNQVIQTATNSGDARLIGMLIKEVSNSLNINKLDIKSDLVKSSISKGKLPNSLLHVLEPKELETYMEYAIDEYQSSIFRRLLEEATHMQYSDKSALLYSVSHNNFKLLKYLVENFETNPRLDNDMALVLACEKQNVDMIQYLLTIGLDPNIDNGYPLLMCVQKNDIKLVKLLVTYGADISKNNHIAMFTALENNNVEMVQYFYEKRYKNAKQPILMPTLKDKLVEKFKVLSNYVFFHNLNEDPVNKMLRFVKNTGSDELIEFLLSENDKPMNLHTKKLK